MIPLEFTSKKITFWSQTQIKDMIAIGEVIEACTQKFSENKARLLLQKKAIKCYFLSFSYP